MNIKTVGDLKKFLHERKESPETFSKKTNISNMTIRRLLKKNDFDSLSHKNRLLINARFGATLESEITPEKIVLSGFGASPKKLFSSLTHNLKENIAEKDLYTRSLGLIKKMKYFPQFRELQEKVLYLLTRIRSLEKWPKTLVIAAIVYFLNPSDLIPDVIVGVGFIDDLGVLSLVCRHIDRLG